MSKTKQNGMGWVMIWTPEGKQCEIVAAVWTLRNGRDLRDDGIISS